VPSGGLIARGGLVGYVGCTGHCFGEHLHFELRQNGQPIDPAPFLGR
jgi:murein DD-endopeptidase MepM/ murein hydrolase activator NlpD